jgi:cytochrome c553
MKDHAILGVTMRDAVTRGDLEAARRAANALAELPIESGLSSSRRGRLDAMILAAQHARAAQDMRDAARSLSALAETCGACHTAFGGPRTVSTAAPTDEPDLKTHMLRHQWGAARLWEGLAVPSDEAWKSGAQVLSDAPFPAERLTPGKSPVPAIGKLTKSVHDLGRKAVTLEDSSARVELYGELMATCASCHQWLGGGPSDTRK